MAETEGHDVHFESADAGASLTYPQAAGTVRKNGFLVIKGRPCKVRIGRDTVVMFTFNHLLLRSKRYQSHSMKPCFYWKTVQRWLTVCRWLTSQHQRPASTVTLNAIL